MSTTGLNTARAKSLKSVIVLLTVLVSWSGYIDRKTETYVDSATLQALGAFATARVLNRVITTATSVEVESSAVVGSVSIRPLELLAPLHDVIERYSVVMELAIVSLVTQKVLIELTAAIPFKLLLTFLGVLLVASIFIKDGRHANWLFRLFILLAFVRFLFVATIAASGLLDQAYLNKKTERNISSVRVTTVDLEQLETATELSQADREALKNRFDQIDSQTATLAAETRTAESALREAEQQVREAEEKVASIEKKLGLVERNNPFTDNQALISAREELRLRKSFVADLRKSLEVTAAAQESAEQEAREISATLQGERPSGWLANLTSRAKSMLDISRFQGLGERVTNIIPNILNLIALFLLKTLFIPLVVLALLLRGFRYIWGVDLRGFGRHIGSDLQSELPVKDSKKGN